MKKGPQFEKDVIEYLRLWGWPDAERRLQGGKADRGDVAGVAGWVIEVKNQSRLSLAEWLEEAKTEAANAGVELFAVWHKRRMQPVANAYVTMPAHVFAALISRGRP